MGETAKKTLLTELLRNVPKDLRAGWPTQWSDDGIETGHAMCPIGRYCQDAADRIEQLEAENARLKETTIPRPVIDWIGTDAPDPRDAYTSRINGHVVGVHSTEQAARNHAWALDGYLGVDCTRGG